MHVHTHMHTHFRSVGGRCSMEAESTHNRMGAPGENSAGRSGTEPFDELPLHKDILLQN
jgi:hypothetical protein